MSQIKHREQKRFDALSASEVLALAIQIERANTRRFRAFASSFEGYDEEVCQHFIEMAEEEESHEAMLLARFWERFGETLPEIDEADVDAVIESMDLDDAEHQIFDSFQPKHVFELALQAELHAQAFYQQAVQTTRDPQLATLYHELAAMEDSHALFLQQRLERLQESEDAR